MGRDIGGWAMKSVLLAIPSAFLIGSANVILKWRLDYFYKLNIRIYGGGISKIAIDPYVVSGIIATGMSILWWLYIMPKVKVGIVYPIIQAGAIMVTTILATLFLHEELSKGQALGIFLLVLGIVIAACGDY